MVKRVEVEVTIRGSGQACNGLGLSQRPQLVHGVQAVRLVPDVRSGNLIRFGRNPGGARC